MVSSLIIAGKIFFLYFSKFIFEEEDGKAGNLKKRRNKKKENIIKLKAMLALILSVAAAKMKRQVIRFLWHC